MQRGNRLGEIIRLQIQQVPLKASNFGYAPEYIVPVERSAIDALGVVGWDGAQWVVDTHHKAHPSGRGGGKRPVSVGFTAHYAAMADRFGSAPFGIAGENILIEGPAMTLEELGVGLLIEAKDGDELLLERPRVAAPCAEFTSFMLGLDHVAPRPAIIEPLADLHDGRRGFIVSADHATKPQEVNLGDVVYLIDG